MYRVTVVDGTVRTGAQAKDGSINVIKAGAGLVGAYHPCGAWYVNVSPGSALLPLRGLNGAMNTVQSSTILNSGQQITVVSGVLS